MWLQVAIAVFIATALGYGIVLPDSAVQSAYARQFSQACKWSAITSLTISAPVILPSTLPQNMTAPIGWGNASVNEVFRASAIRG